MKFGVFGVVIGILLVLFFAKNVLTLDTDFGWHMRMGQIIRQSGIPQSDPLSYTMPSYPFVDHEWLTNVLISWIYEKGGYAPLAVIATLIALCAFFLQIPHKYLPWSPLFIILIITAIYSFAGVRTQVLSWLFLSLMYRSFYSYDKLGWHRILFIPLMLVWTNMHGSFPTGLVVFALFLIGRYIQKKRVAGADLLLLGGGALATFINPYQQRIWWEVWMQVSDRNLHVSILEWMPALIIINLALWMYLVITAVLGFHYRRHLAPFEIIINIFFFLAGMGAYRHIMLWLVVSLRPALTALDLFSKEVAAIPKGSIRLSYFYTMLCALAILTAAVELVSFWYGGKMLRERENYPQKAITYIRQHMPEGNIFTLYEWGGYLSWKLPEKRVFIDGRMPSWRWSAPNKSESDNAFEDYRKIVFKQEHVFPRYQKQYNIELVLLPVGRPREKMAVETWLSEKIQQVLPQKTTAAKPFNRFGVVEEIYADNQAVIYRVVKNQNPADAGNL